MLILTLDSCCILYTSHWKFPFWDVTISFGFCHVGFIEPDVTKHWWERVKLLLNASLLQRPLMDKEIRAFTWPQSDLCCLRVLQTVSLVLCPSWSQSPWDKIISLMQCLELSTVLLLGKRTEPVIRPSWLNTSWSGKVKMRYLMTLNQIFSSPSSEFLNMTGVFDNQDTSGSSQSDSRGL